MIRIAILSCILVSSVVHAEETTMSSVLGSWARTIGADFIWEIDYDLAITGPVDTITPPVSSADFGRAIRELNATLLLAKESAPTNAVFVICVRPEHIVVRSQRATKTCPEPTLEEILALKKPVRMIDHIQDKSPYRHLDTY